MSSAIDNPREYWKLTDCILKDIELSEDPAMSTAKELVQNIRKRRLYRFVDEFILPMEVSSMVPKVTPAMVSGHNLMPVDLRPEHIIVHDHVLNYGSKVWVPGEYVCTLTSSVR